MGENSKINWTDHSFNPWWGCQKISPGCENCYAEVMASRFSRPGGPGLWGPGSERRVFGEQHWKEPLAWERKAKKGGVNKRVLCGSMCDVFDEHKGVVTERAWLWELIRRTPHLTWMILTKRPENIEKMLPERWSHCGKYLENNPMPNNVWLGITTENQAELERRWPVLEDVGIPWYISKLFVSAEPLLGPLDLDIGISVFSMNNHCNWNQYIEWVIVGGETGNNARPMNPYWVRSIQRQCKETGVPFFFKGWGEWGPMEAVREGIWAEGDELVLPPMFKFEGGTEVFKWGKENLVNRLDGQIWEEYPKQGEGGHMGPPVQG